MQTKTLPGGLVLLCVLALASCSTTGITQTTAPQPQEQQVTRIPAADSRITVMGRTQALDDGSLRFAYPGVTLKFSLSARAARLWASSTGEQSYLEVIVDGGDPRVIKLSASREPIHLFSPTGANANLADLETKSAGVQTHSLEIIHRSETWHGLVTVEGLELIDGDLNPAPALPEKRLLILGDSVTCGEAIERVAGCKKDSSWWNPRLSYGMLTAEALAAQVHLVCYGGRGLVRSWNGKTDDFNLPDYLELTIADAQDPIHWDHSRYTPDLILSAIGTNDFSQGIPEREIYISRYVNLVQRLLVLYPQAQIVLTEGAILNGDKKAALSSFLAETHTRLHNPRVHLIASKHYPGDDCDAHPTKAQHAAMAKDLSPELNQILQAK